MSPKWDVIPGWNNQDIDLYPFTAVLLLRDRDDSSIRSFVLMNTRFLRMPIFLPTFLYKQDFQLSELHPVLCIILMAP